MRKFLSGIAATTILMMLGTQAALAAEDIRDLGNPERRTAVFAGASLRTPLGGAVRQRAPVARLQLGATHTYQDMRSASPAVVYRVSGFELGASRRGAPALSIAGVETGEMERRLGISTGAAIGIGVAVGVVALLAVAAASYDGVDVSGAFGED